MRLKEIRTALGLNQAQIADDLHVSRSLYGYWESGKRDPSTDMIIAMANYFNVSTDYLLGRPDMSSPGLSPREKQLLDLFSKLSETEQREVISYVLYVSTKKSFMDAAEVQEKDGVISA